MKTIQLHPTSLFVGAAVVGLAFLTMAQTPQPISPTAAFRSPQPIINARDYVQIRQGTPFIVPPNKIFVGSAVGRETVGMWGQGSEAQLRFNGQLMATVISACGASTGLPNQTHSSVCEIPRGLTATSGVTITVTSSQSDGVAWGYLADA